LTLARRLHPDRVQRHKLAALKIEAEVIGMGGLVENPWTKAFLLSPALTIGGGTSEVQKNILAQRALGLPRDR
jgi:alkylation response protein AidB-like acyl-CoA dehydrogenase